ncbi:MAG: hypothetical protein R2710_16125 [Acidimicrobiales bacterium]
MAPSFEDDPTAFVGVALAMAGSIEAQGGLATSLAVPTWFYGHEPSNPFASHLAKYFSNSEREAGLLAIADGGIVYVPGGPGRSRSLQDAAQNAYRTIGSVSDGTGGILPTIMAGGNSRPSSRLAAVRHSALPIVAVPPDAPGRRAWFVRCSASSVTADVGRCARAIRSLAVGAGLALGDRQAVVDPGSRRASCSARQGRRRRIVDRRTSTAGRDRSWVAVPAVESTGRTSAAACLNQVVRWSTWGLPAGR